GRVRAERTVSTSAWLHCCARAIPARLSQIWMASTASSSPSSVSVAHGRPKPLIAPSGGSEPCERGGPTSVAHGRPKPLIAPSGGSEPCERGGPTSVAHGRPKPLIAPSGGSEPCERGGPTSVAHGRP